MYLSAIILRNDGEGGKKPDCELSAASAVEVFEFYQEENRIAA
jgi:hypothetical protein